MTIFERVLVWAGLLLAVAVAPCVHAQTMAVVNARIVAGPEAEPISHGTLLIRDGRIAAFGDAGSVPVPEGLAVLDAGGGTVVAGFWNSHVHLIAPPLDHAAGHVDAVLSDALTSAYLRWGFTTVFDIASAPGNAFGLRARIAAGEVRGPAILTVDEPFFPKDGVPGYVPDTLGGWSLKQAEVATAAEASTRARRQLAQGADGLKIFAGSMVGGEVGVLPMDLDIAHAVAAAAYDAGKPLFAHPSNTEGMEVAMAAGVDVFAHTTPNIAPWPEAMVRRLVEADIALVPTLALIEVEVRKEGAPAAALERMLANASGQLRAFSAAGGDVLFGTDAGYAEVYDTRDELRLMHEAGLDWRQVLASLTSTPAARFGQRARKGRIAEGMDADLVILAGDPAVGIEAFADVRYTLIGGRVVYAARAGESPQVKRPMLENRAP